MVAHFITFQSLTFDRHSWGGATGEFFRVRTVQLDDFSAESADLSFHHVDIAKWMWLEIEKQIQCIRIRYRCVASMLRNIVTISQR